MKTLIKAGAALAMAAALTLSVTTPASATSLTFGSKSCGSNVKTTSVARYSATHSIKLGSTWITETKVHGSTYDTKTTQWAWNAIDGATISSFYLQSASVTCA